MSFEICPAKGIDVLHIDRALGTEHLHVHRSELGPGDQAHAEHQHPGEEALYLLDGEGDLRIGEDRVRLARGHAVVFDPQRNHTIVNTGHEPMHYLVMMVRSEEKPNPDRSR